MCHLPCGGGAGSSQQVLNLQEQVGQGQEERGSLESKLDHRGGQVEELQREVRERCKEGTASQREVRTLALARLDVRLVAIVGGHVGEQRCTTVCCS